MIVMVVAVKAVSKGSDSQSLSQSDEQPLYHGLLQVYNTTNNIAKTLPIL